LKSLRFRVLALVAGFGLVTALLLASIMFSAVRAYYADVVHEKSSAFVERVLEMHPELWRGYARNPEGFGARLSEFTLYAPNTGLYLLDDEGRVLAASGETRAAGALTRIDLAPVRRALAEQSDAPVVGQDPERPGQSTLVAARPVTSQGRQVGWLYVVSRATDIAGYEPALLRSYAVRTAVTVSLLTLALGVLLTAAMLALLTRPLIGLTRVVEQVRDSGFPENLSDALAGSTDRDDEIGRLGRTFRDTFERLRVETQRVGQTDARRREMVASVSHDLRTPLTALLGQLETIRIKGDSIPVDQQRALLGRAILNAQHLQRLTDALAELARLDNPEFRTNPEPIAIGELTDDVAQRFMSRAADEDVSLEITYPDALPLVRVDAGLVERALANLLDNALRVTPRGGQVRVRVVHEGGGVRIEVSDTGPGVPPEDQPRVFERFYQGSAHRDLRGSSGLGLAIVRRVAELHGGRAGLRSAPGNGSTFFIDLPIDA
jgi:signal transduction histidine kinase